MKESNHRNRSYYPEPLRDRWIEHTGDGTAEACAGALFREAVRLEPLGPDRLGAIYERLRGGVRRRRPHAAWRVATAFWLMLSGSALTAAAHRYLHWPTSARIARSDERELPPPAPPNPRAHSVRGITPLEPVPAGDRVALLDPSHIGSTVHAGRHWSPLGLKPLDPPGTTPRSNSSEHITSALGEESRLLAEALRKLRHNGDASGALASLDEHDVRFAHGALAPEAALARIEALIRSRRDSDALSLLDRMAPLPIGTGRYFLIARAELRAAAAQCVTANTDFDTLLQGSPASDSITERALWGRASCRSRGTNTNRARRDLYDYLSRFPNGRFAGDAHRALRE
jgi:hypothetical protein